VKLIGRSEEGIHIQLNYNQTAYIYYSEIEVHRLIQEIKYKFEFEWSSKWEEIKATLPTGPTIPYIPQPKTGLVQEGADLYLLTIVDLLLAGISRTVGEKILKGIVESKTKPLDRVITALGIRHISEGTSKLLTKYYNSLDSLGRASIENLYLIEGLGETRISSLFTWFHSEGSWRTIEKLRLGGVDYAFGYQNKPQQTESQIRDKTFMFTGKLTLFTRSQAQSLVEEKSGVAGVSVSKTTDYLVVGDKPGSKLAQASLLGVKVISEKEFLELVSPSKF